LAPPLAISDTRQPPELRADGLDACSDKSQLSIRST